MSFPSSPPRGGLLVGMLWFEDACRRAPPVERPGVGFPRLFKPCCFVLLTRRWRRLETRPPDAPGSFPKLFAFTMTLAPPVPPCLIFLTDTRHCKIQCNASKLTLTPVAGLNLLQEKVSRFCELSSEFEFWTSFSRNFKVVQYSREKDKTLFSEFFLYILSILLHLS